MQLSTSPQLGFFAPVVQSLELAAQVRVKRPAESGKRKLECCEESFRHIFVGRRVGSLKEDKLRMLERSAAERCGYDLYSCSKGLKILLERYRRRVTNAWLVWRAVGWSGVQ
jgi:hypothetical protein